jgi:SAM-dependent methyltransferase
VSSIFKSPFGNQKIISDPAQVFQTRRVEFSTNDEVNLEFLLSRRYSWINKYVEPQTKILELGAGAGFASHFIESEYYQSDIIFNNWLDIKLDAQNLPFKNECLDLIFLTDVLLHLPNPTMFFSEICRVLKPNGYLLVHDVHSSLLHRFFIKIFDHCTYDKNIDPFNSLNPSKKKSPLLGNIALPSLLFRNKDKFHERFEKLEIIEDVLCEVFVYLFSGGITARSFTINLSKRLLSLVESFDNVLIRFSPDIFALSRRTVIRKCD